MVSVRDVTGVVTPPDKSLHCVSYHRQIDVSACQLDPCCRRFLSGSSGLIASSKAPCLENVLPGTHTHFHTHPPSFHSFLRLSYIISFLPLTFNPSSFSTRKGRMIACWREPLEGRVNNKASQNRRREKSNQLRAEPPDTEPKPYKHTWAAHALLYLRLQMQHHLVPGI